jgi:hypothetical protein
MGQRLFNYGKTDRVFMTNASLSFPILYAVLIPSASLNRDPHGILHQIDRDESFTRQIFILPAWKFPAGSQNAGETSFD